MAATVKACLDNNVVCAIAKDDTPAHALGRLLVAYDKRKVGLVTSELTIEEIKRYRGNTGSSRHSGVLKRFRSFDGMSFWELTAAVKPRMVARQGGLSHKTNNGTATPQSAAPRS
jgi:hypothetical protein